MAARPERVAPATAGGGKASPVQPRAAGKAAPFVNSLGQEFVPVPETRVLFCRWETRVRDYAAYAKASAKPVDDSWTKQEKRPRTVSCP